MLDRKYLLLVRLLGKSFHMLMGFFHSGPGNTEHTKSFALSSLGSVNLPASDVHWIVAVVDPVASVSSSAAIGRASSDAISISIGAGAINVMLLLDLG